MKKIQKASKIIRIILQICFVLIILAIPFSFFDIFYEQKPGFLFIELDINTYYWSLTAKSIIFAGNIILGILAMYGLYISIKLFRCFEQGLLFTKENAKYLKTIGLITLAGAVLEIIAAIIFVSNPAFDHNINIFINDTIFGLFFIFVSWLIDEGRKQKETVDNSGDLQTA